MQGQRGVALILAMLVVTLVTAITIELSWRFDLSMSRSANRWHGTQAKAYLLGAEEAAYMLLNEDFEEDQDQGVPKDTLGEWWANPDLLQKPTDEGWIKVVLEDAQGRFNLNHLKQKAPKPKQGKSQREYERLTAAQRRFIRLLQTIQIGEEEDEIYVDLLTAENITLSISDWLDRDSDVSYGIYGGQGAESDYYSRLEPPFVIANQEMVSVSELLLIKGMTPEIYQKLLPMVICLGEDNGMNVNTMPVQMLRMFNAKNVPRPLTLEAAMTLNGDRMGGDMKEQMMQQQQGLVAGGPANMMGPPEEGGFDNIEAFKQALQDAAGEDANNLDTSSLDVKTGYFLMFGETLVGETTRSIKVMLQRDNGKVKSLYRTDANF